MDHRGAQKKLSLKKGKRSWIVFLGMERRLRGAAADQEWNAYAKKRYKIAAADARTTAETEDGNPYGLQETRLCWKR